MAGISAGGMATYLWIDYLRGLVNDPNKVYGIVDSGIFFSPLTTAKFHVQAFQLGSLFAPNALLQHQSTVNSNTAQNQKTNNPNEKLATVSQHVQGQIPFVQDINTAKSSIQ